MSCKLALILVAFVVCTKLTTSHSQEFKVDENEPDTSIQTSTRLANFLESLRQTSSRAASSIGDLIYSIPFGKIALAGGALLSIFFLFLRLLIVLGPVLILGALTRESTEPTDLLRMLIEFYNQMIVALDEQQSTTGGPELRA